MINVGFQIGDVRLGLATWLAQFPHHTLTLGADRCQHSIRSPDQVHDKHGPQIGTSGADFIPAKAYLDGIDHLRLGDLRVSN